MNKGALRACVLLAVSPLAVIAGTARAQDASGNPDAPPVIEDTQKNDRDIIVTGTRSALENAERVKRDSAVLLDGISADDIGALPDESISDSLVRIPGITANDKEDGFDQVSVRGLGPDLTNTTYNGRILPTLSGNDRRSNLGSLPTEGLGAAYVQKTSDAATIEGGLGGTINLISIHPLETRRRGLTLVGRVLKDDVAGRIDGVYGFKAYGLRGEATYVGKLTDRLGVALSYAYIEQTNASPSTQFDTYRTGTGVRADVNGDGTPDNYAYANNAGITMGAGNQSRHSVVGMIQWKPVDALMISADGFFIKAGGNTTPIRYFANGAGTNTSLPSSVTATDNVVTQFQGNVALYRQIVNSGGEDSRQLQGGLNIAFDNGGPFKFKIDASYAQAKVDGQAQQATIENDSTNGTATGQILPFGYDVRDINNPMLNFAPLLPEDFALSQILLTNPTRTDTTKAFRADFEYDRPLGPIESMTFGLRYDDRHKINRPDGKLFTFGTVANPGPRPDLDSSYLVADTNPLANIAQYLGGETGANFPLFDISKLLALENAPGVVVNNQVGGDLAGRANVGELTYALYYQANLRVGALSGNIGLRYFITDETVKGFSGTTEANATPLTVKHSYDYLLPALNLRYEITRPLIARFALSKTLSRPVFGNMRIGSAVDLTTIGDNPTISRGNPDLRPFESTNVDLSLEWYPNRATSFAIQAFYKRVTNFILNVALPGTIMLPDGTSIPATINTNVNDPTPRSFGGIEIIARRDFDFLPGFLKYLGVRADFTHNWTNVTDTFNSVDSQIAANQASLTPNNFTPNVMNAQLYYSRPSVDIRLAYRYYDQYSRAVDNAYQTKPGGVLDLSGSVLLVPGVRAIGTIRNITKSPTFERFVDYRNPDNYGLFRSNVYDGRTVTVGVRAQF